LSLSLFFKIRIFTSKFTIADNVENIIHVLLEIVNGFNEHNDKIKKEDNTDDVLYVFSSNLWHNGDDLLALTHIKTNGFEDQNK